MAKNDYHITGDTAVVDTEPEFLPHPHQVTQTIDFDAFFSRDVSTSGSYDVKSLTKGAFGKLLSALPVPTLLVDAYHTIRFANDATGKLGDAVADVVGVPFASLFNGPSEMQSAIANLEQVFSDRKTRVFEASVRLGRQKLWCRIHMRAMRFRNDRSILVLVEDLTVEKKQLLLSEKYRQLVQVFPIGIAEFALDTPVSLGDSTEQILTAISEAKLVDGNHEFARICGDKSIEGVQGAAFKELFPFHPNHQMLYYLWAKHGFPIRAFETRETQPDKRSRFYENTLVGNVKNESLLGFWGMRRDITVRKESEELLRAARDKLEERVKERTAELMEANRKLTSEIHERERAERELETLVEELKEALAKVKTLSGLLPICANCKKIRDDQGYWIQVEVFVREHSDADFTHGLCPDCVAALYPEFTGPR